MNKLLKDTRTLVMIGLMLGITIILDMTPLGAIPVGPVSATITHIPAVITGIILGPVAGLIMGTAFGIVSLLHALLRPATVLDPLFMNPVISVLPRMFIGLTAYYAFAGIKALFKTKKVTPVAIGIGAAIGSFTNTVLTLGVLVIVYGQRIAEILAGLGLDQTAMAWALGTAASYGLAEAAVSIVLAIPIAMVYFRTFDRQR